MPSPLCLSGEPGQRPIPYIIYYTLYITHKAEAGSGLDAYLVMRIIHIIQIRNPALHIVWNAGLFWKKAAATYSPAGRSTIGADGLNFSVRNGKRWSPVTIAT